MDWESGYRNLFSALPRQKAPAGLVASVMERIEARRRRMARVHLSLSVAGFGASLYAFVLAFGEFRAEAAGGFSQFFSLLFSDAATVIRYGGDFALSLVESFPVTGTVALLGSVLVVLIFFRSMARDAGMAFHRRSRFA
ncbi:MAG: hypothetical protein V1656_00685 [Candidatus Jorgensenbacteria bacterium]